MSFSIDSAAANNNSILALLTGQDLERIAREMEAVPLDKSQVIYQAGGEIERVYFPTSGLISLLSATADGKMIEIGMVGREGFLGLSVLWKIRQSPFQAMVQVRGSALRASVDFIIQEFERCGALHSLLLRYHYALFSQVAQSAVCGRFHTIEERLCRWLLFCSEGAKSERLELTQEFLSHRLGATRSHITMTIRLLQRAGLIACRRGSIEIIDRQGLKDMACECYEIVKKEFESYLIA